MRCYLGMELKRAFVNKRMLIALAFGLGLSIWHYFAYVYSLSEYIYDFNSPKYDYPLSAFNIWLGGEYVSLESMLFYMLIPILCALPYGESWLYDCSSSVGGQAMIRGSKKAFIQTKMLVSFLNGAVIVILPLLFDFVLTCTTLPAIIPKAGLGQSPISMECLMGEFFYEHPLIYTLIYIGIDGSFFGLLNTFSVVARMLTSNRYMVILAPFLYYMAFYCVGTTTNHLEICPSGFLRPCQSYRTTWFVLLAELLLMLGICIWSARKFIREEEGLL